MLTRATLQLTPQTRKKLKPTKHPYKDVQDAESIVKMKRLVLNPPRDCRCVSYAGIWQDTAYCGEGRFDSGDFPPELRERVS